MSIEIYTDGSYRKSRDQMGIGVVWLKDGIVIKEYSNAFKGGTNNIAELLAMSVALQSIKQPVEELHIYSDSEYAIGVIFKGWNTKVNIKLINKIKSQLNDVRKLVKKLHISHVKGHEDNDYNNLCDSLATNASLCML